jgi:hypothetical protein
VSRQAGKPKFEDLKVTCGMGMSSVFYDWIADFFQGKGLRQSGEILAADYEYKVRARRHFYEAIISEFSYPKLDANDKGPAAMTVTIAPERIEYLAPQGAAEILKFDENTLAAKLWSSNNFNFTIDGFDDVCAYVTKVDGFSIKQKISEYHHGGQLHPTKHPGRIEWPTLNFYLPEAYAQKLLDRVTERGIKGQYTGKNQPFDGHIETYSNDHVKLHDITFEGAEFSNVSIDKSDASSEEIKQVKFELSIQSMKFKYEPYKPAK